MAHFYYYLDIIFRYGGVSDFVKTFIAFPWSLISVIFIRLAYLKTSNMQTISSGNAHKRQSARLVSLYQGKKHFFKMLWPILSFGKPQKQECIHIFA
jgi:hypothetical protein